MSFKANHINLSNYEEYFILYMDNELNSSEKAEVEKFISHYPHLGEELQVLMNTKLPQDEIMFAGKEDLLSPVMKMAMVDEDLLLYVDNELPNKGKTAVEEKIKTDKDYALQYSLLMQSKLEASEVISHPNKKELYRHKERVVHFGLWMRVAVAVIILLFGSLYFIISSGKTNSIEPSIVIKPKQDQPVKNIVPEQKNIIIPEQKEEPVIVQNQDAKKSGPSRIKNLKSQDNNVQVKIPDLIKQNNDQSPVKREAVALDINRTKTQLKIDLNPINKTITLPPVTNAQYTAYNNQNNNTNTPDDWAVVETEKKTKGKGFFRKVSRFIERNTGIGTVNADNELLVGAVALKLK